MTWAIKARCCPDMGLVSDAAGAGRALSSPPAPVQQGSTKGRQFSQWGRTKSTAVHPRNLTPGLCGQYLNYRVLFRGKIKVEYHFNGKRLLQGFQAGTRYHKDESTWLVQWICPSSPCLGTRHPYGHARCPMGTSHACAHLCQAGSRGLPRAGK